MKLSAGVRLKGRCALGAGASVGADSTLEDCVLFPGTRVGSGCRLRLAVVGPGVELADGFEGDALVVCADSETATDVPEEIERRGGLATLRLELGHP